MSVTPTFTVTLQNGSFVFVCPSCGKRNIHGAGTEGHRHSHCPCWQETGYYITLSDAAAAFEGGRA